MLEYINAEKSSKNLVFFVAYSLRNDSLKPKKETVFKIVITIYTLEKIA